MTISYATATNNARLDAITVLADAGATGALILIQDGTRPATGGTLTNTLATLTMSVTAFTAAASGVLTANTITVDASAALTGTATWFRLTDSAGGFVMDGEVGTDLVLSPTAGVTAANEVSITAFTITAGNT